MFDENVSLLLLKLRKVCKVCDHIHQVYYRVTNHIWMMKLMRAFG
jgi:hypothetical protein